MFGWELPEVALVSNALPPGGSGYQHILEQLVGAIPEEKIAIGGIGNGWGRRARIPFPGRRSAPGVAESLVATGATVLAERFGPRALSRLFQIHSWHIAFTSPCEPDEHGIAITPG